MKKDTIKNMALSVAMIFGATTLWPAIGSASTQLPRAGKAATIGVVAMTMNTRTVQTIRPTKAPTSTGVSPRSLQGGVPVNRHGIAACHGPDVHWVPTVDNPGKKAAQGFPESLKKAVEKYRTNTIHYQGSAYCIKPTWGTKPAQDKTTFGSSSGPTAPNWTRETVKGFSDSFKKAVEKFSGRPQLLDQPSPRLTAKQMAPRSTAEPSSFVSLITNDKLRGADIVLKVPKGREPLIPDNQIDPKQWGLEGLNAQDPPGDLRDGAGSDPRDAFGLKAGNLFGNRKNNPFERDAGSLFAPDPYSPFGQDIGNPFGMDSNNPFGQQVGNSLDQSGCDPYGGQGMTPGGGPGGSRYGNGGNHNSGGGTAKKPGGSPEKPGSDTKQPGESEAARLGRIEGEKVAKLVEGVFKSCKAYWRIIQDGLDSDGGASERFWKTPDGFRKIMGQTRWHLQQNGISGGKDSDHPSEGRAILRQWFFDKGPKHLGMQMPDDDPSGARTISYWLTKNGKLNGKGEVTTHHGKPIGALPMDPP